MRMEWLEEEHTAKMAVIEMEKDLVSMKIEAFMNEMRKDRPQDSETELNHDQTSNHGNGSETDAT